MTIVYIFILLPAVLCHREVVELEERTKLLNNEFGMMLGSDIILSDSDIKANEIIMELKRQELDHAFHHPQLFNISKHFFDYKDEVKETELYKIIQQMPKGAVLHCHDTGLLGPDYLLQITYLPDLYVCFSEDDIDFRFSQDTPDINCGTEWQSMNEARYSSGNIKEFDEELRKYFTIVINNPEEVYTDVNAVWKKFQQYFITSFPLLTYNRVWEQYFYDALKAFREDNIMYIEVRSVLPELYDLDGNVCDSIETAYAYKRALDRFMFDYPDFLGAKLIYAPMRLVDKKTVEEYIETAKELKRLMPDFFAGFDLVGQEDLGAPTKAFLPQLVEASDELSYFFHAGETNWFGTSSDENLVDAIVLNARRIGHAFALIKHPLLMEEVKKRNIGLEINVVSNAVLKLVSDVRNHPLASFLAQDLPVVLSSDDPGVWEADPLSHDFYVVFVAVASQRADLRLLKKLALNSLYYSTHPNKCNLVHEFEIRWTRFINRIVREKW